MTPSRDGPSAGRPPAVAPLVRLADRAAPRLLRAAGFRGRRVGPDSGRLHLLEARGHGAGPPLVVVHGLGSAAADYAWRVAGLLRYTSRLVLPDLPGHGASPAPAGPVSLDAVWSTVERALDAAVEEPFALLGNSLGGYVAVRYAASRPERVRRLVLVSPAGAPMASAELARFWEGFRLDDAAAAHAFVQRFLARPDWRAPILAAGVRTRMGRPMVRSILAHTRPEDLLDAERLRALPMPVLCIWGRRDRVLPESHREFWRGALPPTAEWQEPEGYGHAPFLDDPRDFVRRVGAFLDGQRTGESSPSPKRSR